MAYIQGRVQCVFLGYMHPCSPPRINQPLLRTKIAALRLHWAKRRQIDFLNAQWQHPPRHPPSVSIQVRNNRRWPLKWAPPHLSTRPQQYLQTHRSTGARRGEKTSALHDQMAELLFALTRRPLSPAAGSCREFIKALYLFMMSARWNQLLLLCHCKEAVI